MDAVLGAIADAVLGAIALIGIIAGVSLWLFGTR